MFGNFSGISPKLVISDPLHLLKRARYRILGSKVHFGLTNASRMLDVNVLREILSVPSKVFTSQAVTQMQYLYVHYALLLNYTKTKVTMLPIFCHFV